MVASITPSKQAKAAGLKSLRQASQITGVPERTLYDWFKDKRKLFDTVILGCVAHNNQDNKGER